MSAPFIRLAGICKFFGPVAANQDITLDIRAGRVLALLGENGAGKSTLMSMLAGRLAPDAGTIEVQGRPVRFAAPRQALEAGIGMVYQHFALVESMTVAENVLLGLPGPFWRGPAAMAARVRELGQRHGLPVDPAATIADLSMGQRQRVEILKLLARDCRALILDEPTAVLAPPEVERLLAAVRELASRGRAVVFISHKLEEVLALADDVAVLRHGRVVHRQEGLSGTSAAQLAEHMMGQPLESLGATLGGQRPPLGPVVAETRGLRAPGLEGVDLTLRQGEILAVVGVAGNGQRELVEVLTGRLRPTGGTATILGRSLEKETAGQADQAGPAVGYVPEDRLGLAALPELDLVDNVLLTTRHAFARGPGGALLDRRAAQAVTNRLLAEHNVRPPDARTLAGRLSGGNLQKLVLARELSRSPRCIIAEQPTQGLDVNASQEVWRRLLAARHRAGVLLVTGDVAEALQLADRLAVMFRGRFMDVFAVRDAGRLADLGLLMAGVDPRGESPTPGAQSG